jgi:hypothetical protein
MSPETIGLAVTGWLATTYLTYRWGICAERRRNEHATQTAREGRKREFAAFTTRWRAQFDGVSFAGGGRAEHYQKTRPDFTAEARRIEDDFTDPTRRETFKTLVGKAVGFAPAAVENYKADKGKNDLLEAIDAIIRFIDT